MADFYCALSAEGIGAAGEQAGGDEGVENELHTASLVGIGEGEFAEAGAAAGALFGRAAGFEQA